MQAALAGVLLCASSAALPCSPVPVQQRELDRSAVIATGIIHIIELSERRNDLERVVEGMAELRPETITKNESGVSPPFQFRFQFLHAPDCLAGYLPRAGERARVHLARGAGKAAPVILSIVHYEPIDP